MLHDGSYVNLSKVAEDYDATDRDKSYAYIRSRQEQGEVPTGLLYVNEESKDMSEQIGSYPSSLTRITYADLCPGSEALAKLQERFR